MEVARRIKFVNSSINDNGIIVIWCKQLHILLISWLNDLFILVISGFKFVQNRFRSDSE